MIVCEGEKTEPFYFLGLRQQLRLTSVEVEVCGEECGSAPMSVVEYALQKKKARAKTAKSSVGEVPYDVVWCIFDVEVPPRVDIQRAYDKAIANKLRTALSNPCFEYWYLLHFRKTSRLMQSSDEVRHLLKQHAQNYDKADPKFPQQVLLHTDFAITNSKQILAEKLCNENLIAHNPSTHVHRVVEQLMEMAQK